MTEIRQLSPAQARELLEGRWNGVLLDVREPWEFDIAHLRGARLIPLATLPDRLHELDPRLPVIALCHHGIRSQHAAIFLEQSGFETVFNLEGGIDAWSREIDSGIPRY